PRLIHRIGVQDVPVPEAADLGLNPAFLRAVQAGMFAVTNSQRGTAYGSRIAEASMRLAGKTGTSQVRNISTAERARGVISNAQLPWERRDHALFVGYAPYDAPRYAVSVIVEHGGGGSAVSAPIGRDILLRAMSDGIPALSAYPASQRSRIETMHREMKLRDPESGAAPGNSRA
ncbi:MAG: penicillin-binding transpeptidase domain-containing protein, partial [Paracoccaceae bacterium]|nr:penicillin-binding transpeptidase domain-containing protein [Paracoccaceae bacterium]